MFWLLSHYLRARLHAPFGLVRKETSAFFQTLQVLLWAAWWGSIGISAIVFGFYLEHVLPTKTERDLLGVFIRGFVPAACVLATINLVTHGRDNLFDPVSYITLPVARRTLARFTVGMSILRVSLVAPLLFILSFWYTTGRHVYSPGRSWAWLCAVVAWVSGLHVLAFWVRTALQDRLHRQVVFSAVVATILLLIVSGTAEYLSILFFNTFNRAPVVVVAIGIGTVVASLNGSYLGVKARLYLDHGSQQYRKRTLQVGYRLLTARLNRNAVGIPMGQVLMGVKLETLMILRNRRPIQLFLATLPLAGLFLVAIEHPMDSFLEAAVAFMLTASVMVSYGQYAFSWEAVYFDGLLARPGFPAKVASSRLLMLMAICTLTTGIMWPGVTYYELSKPVLAVYLFNMGVGAPVVLLSATYNRQTIDLSRSTFFNFEGLTFRQTVLGVILMLFPLLIYGAAEEKYRWLAVAVVGVAGILAFPAWTKVIAGRLHKDRYVLGRGFREQ